MKITCCCFTCIIGEDDDKHPERSPLITDGQDDEEVQSHPSKGEKSSISTPPQVASSSKDNDEKKSVTSYHRAAGILRKYNALSTDTDPDMLEKAMHDANVSLKISIKIMAHTDIVKLFALEACNVKPVLLARSPELFGSEEKPIVQLRTKILPTENRGHSKKYEVSESITGALRFSNECLYTFSMQEFQNISFRFRLYNVFKHQRDVMLGEYILDTNALGLGSESGTSTILLEMHEPNAQAKPPEITNLKKSLESMSGSSAQSSITSMKSFQTTIRRGDTRISTRRGIPTFEEGSDTSTTSPERSQKTRSAEPVERSVEESKKEKFSTFEHLKSSVHERSEHLSEVKEAAEELDEHAKDFSALSIRLREKYQKKSKKKFTD
ncbi:uncharacterized protein LOC143450018 [Clavelina lepadiformis]|uniref:C2 NT-type domain-containing protein n=1 Tax=Clavelina lepadiformis TaxID=159417 RepID=A0ABP0GI17_CLALP